LLGDLYIVSTPIGNLNDVSKRSIEVLNDVDLIAAEDTRVTKKILSTYKIKNKLITYNNFNEFNQSNKILKLLLDGNNVALVSDSGTPCISDPGYRIVNSALLNNIKVLSIPGPSSVISALSISGLPTDKFYFEGFLPKKKGLKKRLDFLSTLDATIIIFESPKRLVKTLIKIESIMGNRIISVCKEITKYYETTFLGDIISIIDTLENKSIKGEYVILVAKEGYSL